MNNFITKLSVSSRVLVSALKALGGLVKTNPIVPALENVLVRLEKNTLRLTTSDLQSFLTLEIECESKNQGTFTWPYKSLFNLVSTLEEQPLTIQVDPEHQLSRFIHEQGEFRLSGVQPNDYPKNGYDTEQGALLPIEATLLEIITDCVVPCCSKDDLSPALTGVCLNWYFEDQERRLACLATDKHRIAEYQFTQISEEVRESLDGAGVDKWVIPPVAFTMPTKLLDGADEVRFRLTKTAVSVEWGTSKLYTRLIDAKYPDYMPLLNFEGYDKTLTCQRRVLVNSLARSMNLSNHLWDDRRVKLSLNGTVTLEATDTGFQNELKETIPSHYEGEGLEISFSGKLMSDCLKSLHDEKIRADFKTRTKMIRVQPHPLPDNFKLTFGVMPIMLSAE